MPPKAMRAAAIRRPSSVTFIASITAEMSWSIRLPILNTRRWSSGPGFGRLTEVTISSRARSCRP